MVQSYTVIEIDVYMMRKRNGVLEVATTSSRNIIFVPISKVTPAWKQDIIKIFLEEELSRNLWGEELKALQGV